MWQQVGNILQKYVLDLFYHTRRWVMNAIVWTAIRVAAYEIPFVNIVEKNKPNNQDFVDLNLDDVGDLDGISKQAEAQLKVAEARRAHVTDKCKTLLTFNTALLALIAVFQGKTSELATWESRLFYAAVVAFVVALLVLWTYFDVSEIITIEIIQEDVKLSKTDLQKSLINDYRRCAIDVDNRTDYLVDLYKTSRFYLMVGFVLLFVVFSYNYLSRVESR